MTVQSLLERNLPNEETQRARLEELRKRNLLWIAPPMIPGMSQGMKTDILNVVKAGANIIGVFGSAKDKLFEIMSGDEKAGVPKMYVEAIFADMSGEETAAANIAAAARAAGIPLHGVFSPYEHGMTLVGQVAELLGLMCSPADAFVVARSKHLSREAIRRCGLATPGSIEVFDRTDLAKVAASLRFPMVAKPVSGAGSEGVYRIDNEAQLQKTYERLALELASEECDLNWNPGVGKNRVLFEEFMPGDEFDVDLFLWDGEVVYTNLVANWPCFEPYFKESAAHCPVIMDLAKQEEMKKYAGDCVKAMGFTVGCFHVELIYDIINNGPIQLIEVNPRMGGGYAGLYSKLVYGVDLMLNFVLCSLGIPTNPPRHPPNEPAMFLADLHITCPVSGVLVDNDFMQCVQAHPAVFGYEQIKKAGDKVTGIDTGVPEWLVKFILQGATHGECIQHLRDLEAQIYGSLHIKRETRDEHGALISEAVVSPPVVLSFFDEAQFRLKNAKAKPVHQIYNIEHNFPKFVATAQKTLKA